MHILSLRRLREFWAEHPDAEASLRSWYRVAKQARWQRFTDVRAHYRSADQVGKFTVFNIAGNAYRLITVIHFNTGRVYVRARADARRVYAWHMAGQLSRRHRGCQHGGEPQRCHWPPCMERPKTPT